MKLEKRSAFGWGPTAAGYAPCKNGLVLHYDGSRQGLASRTHESCRAYWKNTRRFHMGASRGWLDIGYSFAVCPHGYVMEGRGWQRQQAAQPGGNSTWTSVTFMSGDGERPTAAQVNAFRELRAWLRGKGLGSAIRGHRDFISTSCPGSVLYDMVKSGALTGAPTKEDDVAISDDDAKKIAKAVLTADNVIDSPPWKAAEGNKYWPVASYLHWGYRQGATTQEKATALEKKVDALAADLAEIKALLQAQGGQS